MTVEAEWLNPNATPSIADCEVHVWRASLDLPPDKLNALEETLRQDEHGRAKRFISGQDRSHFIAARGILRNILGTYLGVLPQSIQFSYGHNGKPAIPSEGSVHPLRFNLSHSHGIALIGISREREVGVDVELIRPEVAGEEIAIRYFSDKEFEELRNLPAGMKAEGFFRCWTRKEAYIKARGGGLRIPLKSFSVSLTIRAQEVLRSPDHIDWCLQSLEPGFGYAGALVMEGNNMKVRSLSWVR